MRLFTRIKQTMDITKDIIHRNVTSHIGGGINQTQSNTFGQFAKGLAEEVDKQDLIYFTEGAVLAFLIFLFYLELNPKIGGIMFRPWSDGKFYFNPFGVIPILKYPFQNTHFWYPENWDLNFVVVSAVGGGLFLALRKSFETITQFT